MFEAYIQEQTDRIKGYPYANTISHEVQEKFAANLKTLTALITGSTLNKFIADEVFGENPYAAILPDIITDGQRKKAEEAIWHKIQTGTLSFPEPLVNILTLQLKNVTDAFLELLCRMEEHKAEICSALFDGKTYTKIKDIELSAGDTHNHGRSVFFMSL